jgi:hypothetical protein
MVVGIAVAAGLAVWLLTSDNRDGGQIATAGMVGGESRIVPPDEATALPDEAGHALYWAGERPGMELEYSDSDGNVHIRYLPEGTDPGASEQTFLDVGTYPFKGAYRATKALADQKGMVRVAHRDGVGFYDRSRPYSVTLAYQDQPNLQIEVYLPEKNEALKVVRSGDIVPLP